MPEPQASIPKRLIANPKAQFLLLLFTILYIVSPVDLIPDVAFPVGWIDDLGVLLVDIVSILLYLKQKRNDFRNSTMNQNKTE